MVSKNSPASVLTMKDKYSQKREGLPICDCFILEAPILEVLAIMLFEAVAGLTLYARSFLQRSKFC